MQQGKGHEASRNSRDADSKAQRQGSMQAMPSKRESSTASQSSSSRPKPPGKISNGKYELDKKLGAGCFGEVFRGVNVETKELVAVKFEALEARTQQLEQEASIMGMLKQGLKEPPQGFPECFYFGREGKYQCLVMECLGRSLEDRLQIQGGQFKPVDTALIAEQLVRRVEFLHSKGIVHRDIKPENFMWGTKGKIHHVFMIDFGLSKKYYDKAHIPQRDKLSLTGTARYASINAHRGVEQSRRDDLEAIGHMLLYFLRGLLPWSGLDARTKEEKYRKIRQKKEETDIDDLCSGYPKEFSTYLKHTRELMFTDRPDYNYLRKLFMDVNKREGGDRPEWSFEWITDAESNGLVSINPYTPPRQPDDLDPDSTGMRRGFAWFPCACGTGKPKRVGDKVS